MKILMLCTKYPDTLDGSYLTSEVADAWAHAGHEVTVAVLQWEAKHGLHRQRLVFSSGVTAHFFQPWHLGGLGRVVERLSRWVASSRRARGKLRRIIGNKRFDCVIAFAPVTPLMALLNDYVGPEVRSYLYVTDFFPIAQRDLRLVPRGPIFALAQWTEARLMRRFGTIGCMSPMNKTFLQQHYALRPEQPVLVEYLWGPGPYAPGADRAAVRARFDLPPDRPIALFGGQLTEGRGVEEVLDAAGRAADAGLDIVFAIIGDGRLRPLVEARAEQLPHNLRLLAPVPRRAYLDLATACDIGLVVTVANTGVPTFPSRTIDYLRAGLPVVGSVEASTDFGAFIDEQGLGRAILAGDGARLLDAVTGLLDDAPAMAAMRAAGRAVLADQFDIAKTAERMLASASYPTNRRTGR